MAGRTAKKKDPAAVALGRKGGKKGGPARAAKLTAKQRSESARKAVQARWEKSKHVSGHAAKRTRMESPTTVTVTVDTSDNAVLALLKRIKATNDPSEIHRLSDRLELLIFHKQHASA